MDLRLPSASIERERAAPLRDAYDRAISYLRLSVTDRCNLRCLYCMGSDVRFLPKAEVLSLEELERLCDAFIRLGVRTLRLTGGEPLVLRAVLRGSEADEALEAAIVAAIANKPAGHRFAVGEACGGAQRMWRLGG